LTGWRRELFGADAIRLKAGEIGLAVRGCEVVTVPLGESARTTLA
jgi:ribonuclease D